MPKHLSKSQSSRPKQQGKNTDISTKQSSEQALNPTTLFHGLLGSADDSTIQGQAAYLNDPHFRAAQHQAIAAQISRAYGNHHLQRVMMLVKPKVHQISKPILQRDVPEADGVAEQAEHRAAVLQDLESLRPTDPNIGSRFGSTEYALRTFQTRIPDVTDFTRVAHSYGMQPGYLLTVFVLEGAFGPTLYQQPHDLEADRPVRVTDAASLVAWNLWQRHGMDDFAVTRRPAGRRDNVFHVHSQGHRSAILNALGNLYAQGLLWNSEGVRPRDPSQQLTPQDILSQLAQQVNLSTQLPHEGFIPLVYRIQAATLASRQQLMGRSQEQLAQLGYSPETARSFRHRAIEVERVRVARENNLFPASVRTDQGRVRWTYRHLTDSRFVLALFNDERYTEMVRSSFEHRMPAEAARITMGTPQGARRAIAQAAADFRRWVQQRAGREAIHRWALDMSIYMIILRGGQTDEARTRQILGEIEANLNQENIPNRSVRQAVQAVMRDWLRSRDYDSMQHLLRFIIETGGHFSHIHIDSARQWIAALAEPRGDTSGIPRALANYLFPTSRAFQGRIRHVLRIYGQSVRFAQGLVEARQELE